MSRATSYELQLRAQRIMNALHASAVPVRSVSLSAELRLPALQVTRMLRALERNGLVSQGRDKRWTLSRLVDCHRQLTCCPHPYSAHRVRRDTERSVYKWVCP